MDIPNQTNQATSSQAISVGVITHKGRFESFAAFLDLLATPLLVFEEWSGQAVELLIINNSGPDHADVLKNILLTSSIGEKCSVRQIDSPKNNIATGRNMVLDSSKYRYIAFIDDDEIPTKQWLIELAKVMFEHNCAAVSGPVHAQYPEGTSKLLKSIDLHNTIDKFDGDDLRYTGTGNVLIDKEKILDLRFDEKYGRTGGSDTDFFLRLTDTYERILWAEKAALSEKIPADRASFRYFLNRCISQGRNFRQIKMARGEIASLLMFRIRAVCVVLLSVCVAVMLLLLRSKKAGKWIKRACANIGFLVKPANMLYE